MVLFVPDQPPEMAMSIDWNGRYNVLVPPNKMGDGTLSEQQLVEFRHHAACANLEHLWFHQADSDRCTPPLVADAYLFSFGGHQSDDPDGPSCGMYVCIDPDTIEGPTRAHVDVLIGLFDELTTAHTE